MAMTSFWSWMLFPLIFLAGFIDSIAGGGGLISLPAYLAAGLPAHMALGTNKFSSAFGTSISAARFTLNGHIQWNSAAASFVGALIGSAAGARFALFLNERVLTWLMLGVIPIVTLFVILKKDIGEDQKNLPISKMLTYSLLVGLLIGAYDGFFGPGTGTFLIMALTAVVGLSLLTACGNAKIINFASNIAAVVTFIISGSVNYKIAVPCAVCGIVGNYLGAGLVMKRGSKIVRPVMIVVIILLLIKIISDLLK